MHTKSRIRWVGTDRVLWARSRLHLQSMMLDRYSRSLSLVDSSSQVPEVETNISVEYKLTDFLANPQEVQDSHATL